MQLDTPGIHRGYVSPNFYLYSSQCRRGLAFANTDLSGVMDHRYSILEADRAVGQLLDQVLTDCGEGIQRLSQILVESESTS
jgi:hypothetical protein